MSASCAGPSKKAPKWPPGALPRSLPGPPGDLLAGPRRPKEAPRAAQEPPRPPQEPPRSASRAVLAAIWRPTAAQEVPRGLQEAIWASSGLDFRPSGGRFLRPRPLHLQPSGKHFRLLLGLSRARPQKPKKPKPGARQHKRITTCQENAKTKTQASREGADRAFSRTPGVSFWKVCGNGLAHKRVVGGVGGAIVNTILSQQVIQGVF